MAEKQANEALEKLNQGVQKTKQMFERKEEDEEEPKIPNDAKIKAEELGIRFEEMEDAGSGGFVSGDGTASLAEGEEETATGTKEEDTELVWQTSGNKNGKEPRATNAAKREAEELGVDLKEIQGTGSAGLITMSDVFKKVR